MGLGTHDGLEVLLLMLVVLVAEVDKLLLEGVLELLEGLDGLVLGGVRRGEFDGLCGGLCVFVSSWRLSVVWELSHELVTPRHPDDDTRVGHTILDSGI